MHYELQGNTENIKRDKANSLLNISKSPQCFVAWHALIAEPAWHTQQSSCVWFSKGGTDSIIQHACTHTYNRYRRWVFLAFFLSSVQYWLSFQVIVMPLLLSLLASCRSLWGICMHLKGLAERKKRWQKRAWAFVTVYLPSCLFCKRHMMDF